MLNEIQANVSLDELNLTHEQKLKLYKMLKEKEEDTINKKTRIKTQDQVVTQMNAHNRNSNYNAASLK